jgi:hypothetical protein
MVETNLEDGRVYRFSEDGIPAYLWLLSAEAKLRAAERAAAPKPKLPALVQPPSKS